jgi:hypothetical protein
MAHGQRDIGHMGMTVTLVLTSLADHGFFRVELATSYGTKAFFSNCFHMKTLQH